MRLGTPFRVLQDITLRGDGGSVEVHAGDVVVYAGSVPGPLIGPAGPETITVARITPLGLMRLPLQALAPLEES